MKNLPFAIIVLMLSTFQFSVRSQSGCIVLQDSVIAGNETTSKNTYTYNALGQIVKSERLDSGATMVYRYDTLFYDGNGNHIKTETYEYTPSPVKVATYTFAYTGNKLTRMDASGTNGGGWTSANDFTYNSSNEIISIIIDTTAVTGSPDSFDGDFLNITWSGNNITYLDLILSGDTIELNLNFDTKNNLSKLLPVREATDYLFRQTENNLVSAVFKNNENMGPAGTKGVERVYTYNSKNDVEKIEEKPSAFEQNGRTTQYFYDCSYIGIDDLPSLQNLNVYPNPAGNSIVVESPFDNALISIFDMRSSKVLEEPVRRQRSVLDVSRLERGTYIVIVQSGNEIRRTSMIKE